MLRTFHSLSKHRLCVCLHAKSALSHLALCIIHKHSSRSPSLLFHLFNPLCRTPFSIVSPVPPPLAVGFFTRTGGSPLLAISSILLAWSLLRRTPHKKTTLFKEEWRKRGTGGAKTADGKEQGGERGEEKDEGGRSGRRKSQRSKRGRKVEERWSRGRRSGIEEPE